ADASVGTGLVGDRLRLDRGDVVQGILDVRWNIVPTQAIRGAVRHQQKAVGVRPLHPVLSRLAKDGDRPRLSLKLSTLSAALDWDLDLHLMLRRGDPVEDIHRAVFG